MRAVWGAHTRSRRLPGWALPVAGGALAVAVLWCTSGRRVMAWC